MYQKHFYLFYQLYQLSDLLAADEQYLHISAIKIQLLKRVVSEKELAEHNALRAFYLDYQNIKLSEDEIARMMDNFWQKYLAIDQKVEALLILGLENEPEISKRKIKNKFTELAQLHHPDKGGEKDDFIKIKRAAEILSRLVD